MVVLVVSRNMDREIQTLMIKLDHPMDKSLEEFLQTQ